MLDSPTPPLLCSVRPVHEALALPTHLGAGRPECMTAGLEQPHTEVFRGPSLPEVLARGERVYAVMPVVDNISEEIDEDASIDSPAG